MKNMFFVGVLCVSVQLFCAADVDTHRDLSFDRSMKGGGVSGSEVTSGVAQKSSIFEQAVTTANKADTLLDTVVGKLDPNGLGVRNFVILHDFESEILDPRQSDYMISEQITWDLYTFLKSQNLIICMTPNLLTNILCNIQFVKDIQLYGDSIIYQEPWRDFNESLLNLFIDMYKYIKIRIDIHNIDGDIDLDFEEDFYDSVKRKYRHIFYSDILDIYTKQTLGEYKIGIFLGLLAESVLEKWDFYTIEKTQYILGMPKIWSESNKRKIKDIVGGLQQRKNIFIKDRIQDYDVYSGILDVVKDSKNFNKINIDTNFMNMYKHPFFVSEKTEDDTFQEIKTFFERFFISRTFLNPKYKDYASFVLPSWNILISGHGSQHESTSGLLNIHFKQMIDTFSKHLFLKSFSYLSCYPAGQKFKELFVQDSTDLRLKKYDFPILAMGSTVAMTAPKLQLTGVDGLYDSFFGYVSNKEYGRAMNSLKSITGADVGNVYMLKDVYADKFVPIRFDEITSIPMTTKTGDKKFKKNVEYITYTQVMDAAKKKLSIDAQKTRGIFLQTHDISSPIEIVRYYSSQYPNMPVFVPQAQSGDTKDTYMNIYYHFASVFIDTIEPQNVRNLFHPLKDNPNESDMCMLIDRLEIKNYNNSGKPRVLTNVVYFCSLQGFATQDFNVLECDFEERSDGGYTQKYTGEFLAFKDDAVIYTKKAEDIVKADFSLPDYINMYKTFKERALGAFITKDSIIGIEKSLEKKKTEQPVFSLEDRALQRAAQLFSDSEDSDDDRPASSASTASESSVASSPVSDDSRTRSMSPVEVDPAAGALLGVA